MNAPLVSASGYPGFEAEAMPLAMPRLGCWRNDPVNWAATRAAVSNRSVPGNAFTATGIRARVPVGCRLGRWQGIG
jgi:hypothetical protein